MPPTFDGPAVLADDDALLEWLVARCARSGSPGCATSRSTSTWSVGWPAGSGIVRETNFGVLWDVRSEPDPITNANTALSLPPHVDLATREYQPGLQFLHCIENSAHGGQGIYLDGFRVAEILRDEHPDALRGADHRAVALGQPLEGQRLPLGVDADRRSTGAAWSPRYGSATGCARRSTPSSTRVEAAYAAYRTLFERHATATTSPSASRSAPGDLLAFDNRRILHGRDAYVEGTGVRFLRGCYGERDELLSRIRILERRRR